MGGLVMNTGEIIPVYITYRRSLGEKFKTNATVLKGFCKHIGADVDLSSIDQPLIMDYLYAPTGTVTAHLFCKYSALKGFYEWALSRGHVSEMPLPCDLPKRPDHITPYIYSDEELKSLFECALTYQKNKSRINPYVIQTVLIVTYTLGLRIHETVSLRLKHLDLPQSCAVICESKFYKSRVVPFNDEIKLHLEAYLEWRRNHGHPQYPESALFTDNRSYPINIHTVRDCFKRIRQNAGICRTDGAVYQPRLHDLRHTFAVKRLTAWYEANEDVQSLLPILSTYLGHKHLAHTSVYLTMTETLLNEACKRFENYVCHG
jgi:integrase